MENGLDIKLVSIDEFSATRNYWFIRTQGGSLFNKFLSGNFVGIEWDEISDLNIINNASESVLRDAVRKYYKNVDKPGRVINQIKRFVSEVKIGDIVLIPSESSESLAIGEVTSDIYIVADTMERFLNDEDEKIPVIKKRKTVKWLKEVRRAEWDPSLTGIIYTNSAIICADKYELYIDRMLSSFYIKGNDGYFTYKVNKKENIPYNDMLGMLYHNNELLSFLARTYPELKINFDDNILKINVQSKGPIQIKGIARNMMIGGIFIVGLIGGNITVETSKGHKLTIESEGIMGELPEIIDVINKKKLSDEEKAELEKILNQVKEHNEKLEIEPPKVHSYVYE